MTRRREGRERERTREMIEKGRERERGGEREGMN